MAVFVFVVLAVALVVFLVAAVMAISNRADMAKRRKWNGWILASAGVALLCLGGFIFRLV